MCSRGKNTTIVIVPFQPDLRICKIIDRAVCEFFSGDLAIGFHLFGKSFLFNKFIRSTLTLILHHQINITQPCSATAQILDGDAGQVRTDRRRPTNQTRVLASHINTETLIGTIVNLAFAGHRWHPGRKTDVINIQIHEWLDRSCICIRIVVCRTGETPNSKKADSFIEITGFRYPTAVKLIPTLSPHSNGLRDAYTSGNISNTWRNVVRDRSGFAAGQVLRGVFCCVQRA